MNSTKTLAWHFTADKLRDGRSIPAVGDTLIHDGPLELCCSGLHASERIIDALSYAPGPTLHRVECSGETLTQDDKLVCRERTILWTIPGSDMRDLLSKWARWCALRVIDLWDAPNVVREYLETGDESKRAAAWDAAWAAARSAESWAAARSAESWDAAAAWDAARSAASAATGAESWAAAWGAEAWDAASAATGAESWAAAWGAEAWGAARAAQNAELERLVMEFREESRDA